MISPRLGGATPPGPHLAPVGGGGSSPIGDEGLRVEVPAGCWRLYPAADAAGARGYVAELTATTPADAPRVAWSTTQPTLWRLEEACGWAIPLLAQWRLRALPPVALPGDGSARAPGDPPAAGGPPKVQVSDGPPLTEEAIRRPAWQPSRASRVWSGGLALGSYGWLRHADRPARRWHEGTLRAELLGNPKTAGAIGDYSRWRILDGDDLVYAGSRIPGETGGTLGGDELLRAVLNTPAVLDRAGLTRTARQQDFVARHRDILTAAGTLPSHLYPPGSRVRLAAAWDIAGTVHAALTGGDGQPRYLWRPDVADLPGHPWQHQPTWTLQTPARALIPTLASPAWPDDARQVIVTTGSLVAAVEDPRFGVGTVLRTFFDQDDDVVYEIQPHDAPLPPLRLPATEVAVLRPSAWPSVDALLAARREGRLPLRPGEMLPTSTDEAVVSDTGTLHTFGAVADPLLLLDITRNLEPIEVPRERALSSPPPAASSTPEATTSPGNGDQPGPPTLATVAGIRAGKVEIDDPVHGRLAVDADAFTAARGLGAERLADLLARRRWLPTGAWPLDTAAALAVIHAPDDLPLAHRPPAPDDSLGSPSTGPTPPAWDGP